MQKVMEHNVSKMLELVRMIFLDNNSSRNSTISS